jgi:hypothetical protein
MKHNGKQCENNEKHCEATKTSENTTENIAQQHENEDIDVFTMFRQQSEHLINVSS